MWAHLSSHFPHVTVTAHCYRLSFPVRTLSLSLHFIFHVVGFHFTANCCIYVFRHFFPADCCCMYMYNNHFSLLPCCMYMYNNHFSLLPTVASMCTFFGSCLDDSAHFRLPEVVPSDPSFHSHRTLSHLHVSDTHNSISTSLIFWAKNFGWQRSV